MSEVKALELQSTDLLEKAFELRITTAQEAEFAVALGREIRTMRTAVRDYWDNEQTGPVKLAHRAWKATVAKRDGMLKPLDDADASVARRVLDWHAEQECRAREGQRKLEEEARQQREAEIADAAARAKEQGAKAAEVRDLKRQLAAMPVQAPPVAPPPKPQGLSVPAPWTAELEGATDQERQISFVHVVRAVATGTLPIAILKISRPDLTKWADQTKGTVHQKGIRVFQKPHVRYGRQ